MTPSTVRFPNSRRRAEPSRESWPHSPRPGAARGRLVRPPAATFDCSVAVKHWRGTLRRARQPARCEGRDKDGSRRYEADSGF